MHAPEYPTFLRWLFPAFRSILLKSPALHQRTDAFENRFRLVLLEILNRLPNNEILKPYAVDLLRLAINIISCDNEENALTCLRIIFDLHKNYRPALESEVQPFLDLVQRIYKRLPDSAKAAFSSRTWHPIASPHSYLETWSRLCPSWCR